MPYPFPGMNPYLEHPKLWREVHSRLIVALADAIEANLSLNYRVAVETRTYLNDIQESLEIGIPDVTITTQKLNSNKSNNSVATLPSHTEAINVIIPTPKIIRENYLEIREIGTGYVVTVIEILSPTNKKAGIGKESYLNKRNNILSSPTHLVEIDLLRGGKKMPIISDVVLTDYRILICRGNHRPNAQLYGFNLPQVIPSFPIPLKEGDEEPLVDLQSLLLGIYKRGRFDLAIDYTKEPVPPLKKEDRIWLDILFKEKEREKP